MKRILLTIALVLSMAVNSSAWIDFVYFNRDTVIINGFGYPVKIEDELTVSTLKADVIIADSMAIRTVFVDTTGIATDSLMEATAGHGIVSKDTLYSKEGVVAPVGRFDDLYEYTSGSGITIHSTVIFEQTAEEFFIIHGDNDTIRFDMRENLYVLGIKVNDDTLFSLDSTGVLTANKFGGNVIYVGSEENFEYNTVDDAVNAASAGDVIAVLPGTYTGHIDADVANVKIIGVGGWKRTILNLTMSANAGINVTADNVVIDGFTLSGDAAGSLILLGTHPDSVHIQNCKFKVDGAATFGLNIGTAGSDYTIVKNNLFMAGSGDGCFYGSKTITNLEMSYNEFIGQDSTSGYAIQTAGLNNAIFKGNKIHGEGHTSGGFASGIFPYCYSSAAGDSIYIEDNTISDCSKAIRLGHTSADFDLKAVFITNNTLHDNSRGVYVANDANCYPATYQLNGNVFYNNTVDIRNDYSTALAAMSNFFEGYFETDELNVLDSLRNEGTELTKGLATFKGGIDADYAETATAADPYRYHDFRVDVNATQTASAGGGLATLYGRIDWDKGDNSTASLGGIEGVASSSSADEAISLRGGHFRTYINANADAAGSTARTSVGLEISARAGYSGANAVQPESGTAFVGGRIWMAPFFATSIANINNFHGLWLYNEHPTYDITNGIYINSASGGGSWTNFLNFRDASDAQMFGVSKTGELYAADSLTTASGFRAEGDAFIKGKAVVNDSLRVESTSIQKGDATFNGKAVIDDSLRVTGTSQFNGDVTIGTAAEGDNLTVNATEDTEMAPTLEAASWTCGTDGTGGWYAGSPSTLRKTASAGTQTATPSGTFAVTAGVTYKVTITCSAVGATAPTYTLGGSAGSTITATTWTDYIQASTTAKIIFSGAAASTCTITSLSVMALPDGTGDAYVYGNLKLASPIQNIKGTDFIYLGPNGLGVGIFNKSPTYALDVTGIIRASSVGYFGTQSIGVGSGTGMLYGAGTFNNGVLTYSANAWYLDNSSWRIGNPTPEDTDDWSLTISSDADADASATTAEHFGINLETNADPTLAAWGITLTQARGFAFTNTSTQPIRGLMSRQFSTDALGSKVLAQKARGSVGSLTTVVTLDTLGQFSSYGYDGTRYVPSASMAMLATGTVGANRMPGKIAFRTATDAAPSVLTDRMVIDNAGVVTITSGGAFKIGTVQWDESATDSIDGSAISANDLPVNRIAQLSPSLNVVTDANGHITTSTALAVLVGDSLEGDLVKANDLPVNRIEQLTASKYIQTDANGHIATVDSLEGNLVKANDLPVNRLEQLTPSVAVVTDANGHVSAAGALSVLVGDSLEGNLVKANDLPYNRMEQLTASKYVQTDANGHIATVDSLNGAVITARTIPAKSIVASPAFITPNIGAATGTSLTLTNNASITNADADTLEITEDNTKFVGNVSTTGALTAAGVVTGESSMTLDTDATIVLTTAMCRNAIRFNADADAIDYTLPGAKKGLVVMFYDIGGGVITIDPVDGTDTIYLDGTTVGAGDAIDSPGVVGNFICLMAIDDTRWVTAGRSGTWVDGGAD